MICWAILRDKHRQQFVNPVNSDSTEMKAETTLKAKPRDKAKGHSHKQQPCLGSFESSAPFKCPGL